MRTIASEVTNYIKTKPFLSTALSQGIINLTSLAREIQPSIEKGLRKPAKSGAIVMALKRISESNIIVSKNISHFVDELFQNEICNSKTENLSSITIKLPDENVTIPGIYYFIFQRLSWEGVNINEVISTSNEFTILMDETQVNIAFGVIKDLKSL